MPKETLLLPPPFAVTVALAASDWIFVFLLLFACPRVALLAREDTPTSAVVDACESYSNARMYK